MLRKKLKKNIESSDGNGEIAGSSQETTNNQETGNPLQTSDFFSDHFWAKLQKLEFELSQKLIEIDFYKDKNVGIVYNPLEYASEVHCNYMKKFLDGPKRFVFLGMNPGYFGMAQSGVPFGHIPAVKNWMKLSGTVKKPEKELSVRPIYGLDCDKEEQSGKRFWGVLEELFGTAEDFFKHSYVHNICPLIFLTSSGKNITPPELKGDCKKQLQIICLEYLQKSIALLQPHTIISVGSYANDRVKDLKKKGEIDDSIECLLLPHPSPRSLNNHNWPEKARKWFEDNRVLEFYKNS